MVTIYNGGFKQHNGTFNVGYVPITTADTGLRLFLNAGDVTSYPGSGGTWFDISGYGNNASLTAATASNFSNNAIKFNRTTNTRAVVPALDLSTTPTITLNMWVKFLSLPTGGGDTFRFLAELSDNYNSFSDSFFTAIATELSTNRWFTQDKGNSGYNAKNLSTPLPTTNTWYNFTVVYDHTQAASNERTFYIDGVNQTNIASTEGGTTYNSDNTNNFGNRPLYIGGRSTSTFSSDMDLGVFQVYNKALNATEVSQSYEIFKGNYPNIVTDGIVLYLDAGNTLSYPGSGTSWFDLYNNVTGSLLNGITYTSAGASSSINLDGTNDYLTFNPETNLTGLTTLTANMWLNIKDVGAVLFYKSDNNSTRGWFIEYGDNVNGTGTNGFGFAAVSNASNLRYYINKNQVPTGSWTNISITWNGVFPNTAGTAVKIYINGTENTNVNYSVAGTGTRSSDTNADPLSFGESNSSGTSNANYYSGSIGIVSLYNRNLTAAEVLQNYNATKAIYGL